MQSLFKNRLNNRRKVSSVVLVEPDFKRKQLSRVMAFAGMYVLLSSFVLGFFYMHVIHPEVVDSRPYYMDVTDSGAIWREFPGLRETVTAWLICMTGLASVFSMAVGLHFSHKLAGPIYRFKIELNRIVQGERVRPIVLRTGDDFQDVAKVLNEALAELERRRVHAVESDGGLEVLESYRAAHAEFGAALAALENPEGDNGAAIEQMRAAFEKCRETDR